MQHTLFETSKAALSTDEFVEIEIAELELREDLALSLFSCCPCLPCGPSEMYTKPE